jgi:N-formylmaleamate deformylase
MMNAWSDGYVQADAMRVHYTRTGGNRTSLILLHGITDNGLCWTRVAKALEHDYDIIMPDARGHGLSDGPEKGFSIEWLAADVAALIRSLQLERPFVLGHSMGAATASTLAARYPDLVRAVLLEDPPWRDTAPVASPVQDEKQAQGQSSWLQWLVPLRAMSREQRIALARREYQWAGEELEPWAESKEQFNLAVVQRNVDNALHTGSWRELVTQIRCPFLLITGDPKKGAIVTAEVAQEVTRLAAQGEVVHVPGAGHNIRRDQYEAFMAAITHFLQEH